MERDGNQPLPLWFAYDVIKITIMQIKSNQINPKQAGGEILPPSWFFLNNF